MRRQIGREWHTRARSHAGRRNFFRERYVLNEILCCFFGIFAYKVWGDFGPPTQPPAPAASRTT